MLIVADDTHRLHAPRFEVLDGTLKPANERPERALIVRQALEEAGLGPVTAPRQFGPAPLAAVHDPGLLAFLAEAWTEWERVHGPVDAIPYTWPYARPAGGRWPPREPRWIDGRLSWWCFDAGTTFTAGTWPAAQAAANAALTGAEALLAGGRHAFALCRPPGHHAGHAQCGGYCFLNNAAIAAAHLAERGGVRVGVLDVDYHHGNGTQDIFWERADVVFASIHADPALEFPYYAGHAEETGGGAGLGATLNLPLPWSTGWAGYAEALERALAFLAAARVALLVVSFGADTYKDDPISHFTLDTPDFARMGGLIAAPGLPVLTCLEGGYAVEALGRNTVAFLRGLGT